MSKKRGGQPQNKNALKHGFYSKYFTALESRALSENPVTSVEDVIDLLRVSMGRFMETYTRSLQDLDYEERLAALRVLGLSGGSIASLVRIHVFTSKNVRAANEMTEAFKKLGVELGKQEKQGQE